MAKLNMKQKDYCDGTKNSQQRLIPSSHHLSKLTKYRNFLPIQEWKKIKEAKDWDSVERVCQWERGREALLCKVHHKTNIRTRRGCVRKPNIFHHTLTLTLFLFFLSFSSSRQSLLIYFFSRDQSHKSIFCYDIWSTHSDLILMYHLWQ